MAITKPDHIRDIVASLPIEDQERVLTFVQDLLRSHLPPGTPGRDIVRRSKSFPQDLADALAAALEDCERIEANE